MPSDRCRRQVRNRLPEKGTCLQLMSENNRNVVAFCGGFYSKLHLETGAGYEVYYTIGKNDHERMIDNDRLFRNDGRRAQS